VDLDPNPHIAGCPDGTLPRHYAGTICEGAIFDLPHELVVGSKKCQIAPNPHILPLNTYFNRVNQPGDPGQL